MAHTGSYFKINGQEVPYPKRGIKPTVITVVDSARNADGVVVGQKIGRDQYKLDAVEWPYLSAEEWSRILTLCSNFWVNVTFFDMVTNIEKTMPAYVGDRTAEPFWVDETGRPTHYIKCKVNFIDTGHGEV